MALNIRHSMRTILEGCVVRNICPLQQQFRSILKAVKQSTIKQEDFLLPRKLKDRMMWQDVRWQCRWFPPFWGSFCQIWFHGRPHSMLPRFCTPFLECAYYGSPGDQVHKNLIRYKSRNASGLQHLHSSGHDPGGPRECSFLHIA